MSDLSNTAETVASGPALQDVTCSKCSHGAQIMAYGDDTVHPVTGEAHEIRWQCPCAILATPCDCNAANVIAGHPGMPGEGALNPAAAALSDDEIMEAATRRGLLQTIELSGEVAPTGSTEGGQ